MSLISIPNPMIRLLLHKKLHNHFGTIGNGSTWAEDGGDTGLIQEVIVLCGDDTTGGDHDVGSAEFLEFLDDLRDKCLMTGCLVGSGLQRVEKFRFSRELPRFLLLNQNIVSLAF